jgi:hypothetical protein
MYPPSYIGMTGFSTREQVEAVLAHRSKSAKHYLMIGVLVSHKSLHGQPLDQPKRYPPREVLGDIFTDGKQLLNLLHFNTNAPEQLLDDMLLAQDLAGIFCHGFQLNMMWPDIKILQGYRKFCPTQVLVLQCGKRALEQAGSPQALADRVGKYEGLIDYVLIDGSGGLGLPFDEILVKEYFSELSKLSGIGFGVAGGLEPGSLYRLHPVWRKFSNFSIDAESGLRINDKFSIHIASQYLSIAEEIFKQRTLVHASE